MSELAGKQKPDFIVNVGDNIYFNGVDNVEDSRFDVSNNELMATFVYRRCLKSPTPTSVWMYRGT